MLVVLATGFLCTSLSSHISDVLSGKSEPELYTSYDDTSDNRASVIAEVANLYGYFLTYQAHEKKQCSKLRNKGIWLEIKTADDYFPPQEKVDEFIHNLIGAMEVDFAKNKEWGISTKLGVDYGPDCGALYEAFQKTALDIRCYSLLPYKSLTYLEIKEDQIKVNMSLKGPLL